MGRKLPTSSPIASLLGSVISKVPDSYVKIVMKRCNVCKIKKPEFRFKVKEDGTRKKTCRSCERTWANWFLRMLVKQRKLTPAERLGNRLGYMGTAFIMMSPYLLPYDNIGAYTYIAGALLSLPQVWLAKQWNLVIVNFNLLIGYGAYIWT